MKSKNIEEKLKHNISAHRYEHTLGVVNTVRQLAAHFNVDPEKAELAALLHDCARDYADDKLLQLAKEFGIELDLVYRHFPAMLHGPVGAMIARQEYGVLQPDVLQAISIHTLGSGRMDDLAKVLMVADSIEPGRSYKGVNRLRKEVYACKDNLNLAVLNCLEFKMASVIKSRYLLHPTAVEARNALLMELNCNNC
ncbi:bis(5'-nucleosyl)-tetraphosphatase (symmetrical) YqeK [Desulfofalx alkaliphila]|uniref:bis(5'-nucleosyl)-tetraphosphatase (symmetrical) YqeK n=1 Tax=Desulfofalx alkaliphila TaxID=105483 RepID=UPI0004E1D86C|nr:bis(5'-nucleosyl)-tetraphosphatase (symmetrical) YqeK [Desulfofalx alkaliphila]